MSNKTDLQENNVKLQTIKNNIEELPESNAWTGQTSIVPGTQAITIPAYTDEELTIQGDVNLIASNIAKGKTIFNVTGTYEQPLTSYGIDFGTVTPTGSSTLTVKHNLGKIPSFYAVMPKVGYDYDNASIITVFAWIFNARLKFENGIAQNGANISLDIHDYDVDATKNTITFDCGNYRFCRGVEHIWIAIA